MDNRKLGKERGTQGKNTIDNRVGRFDFFLKFHISTHRQGLLGQYKAL